MDELLYAISSRETPPELSAFAFQSNADVKERAAGAFEGGEFGQGLVGRRVERELELKPVRQLLNAQDRRT